MFHVADGLFFERYATGEVRVVKTSDGRMDGPIVFDQIINMHVWASVIATMSYYGEEDYGYYRALDFHAGIPVDATTPLKDKTPEQFK